MKKYDIYFLNSAFLLCTLFMIVSCGGGIEKTNNTDINNNNAIQKESKSTHASEGLSQQREDVRKFKVFPIQKDTSLYHYFNDIKVKKYGFGGGGYGSNGIKRYTYTEMYPYILNKGITQKNKTIEVLYYDSTRSKVLKKIDVPALNPYLKKYDNIRKGFPTFEYYETLDSIDAEEYKDAEPDEYLTYYDGGGVGKSGYSNGIFSLVGVKDNKILSWESTFVILDRDGTILTSIREPNEMGGGVVSEDGRLVAYIYGNCLSNPYDDAPNGEVRIYDVRLRKVIKIFKPPVNAVIVWLEGVTPDIIDLGYVRADKRQDYLFYIDYINFKNRTRYLKVLNREEMMRFDAQYNVENYYELLDSISISKETF